MRTEGYDVYGQRTVLDHCGCSSTDSIAGNRFAFTGREWLGEVGLYDYRHRVYSPAAGRFLQPDPIGFEGGDVNWYRYVGNEPVFSRDPTGRAAMPAILAVGAIALVENWLHWKWGMASYRYFPTDDEDRERHCFVNCVSTTFHQGVNLFAMAFSIAKEYRDLAFGNSYHDSIQDMATNLYGQIKGFGNGNVPWRDTYDTCAEQCKDCPTRRSNPSEQLPWP
jgi:RHS repeat-associated protein